MARPGSPDTTFTTSQAAGFGSRIERVHSDYNTAATSCRWHRKPSGWMNNVKLNVQLGLDVQSTKYKGRRWRGPAPTGILNRGPIPKDLQLQKYLNDLRKEKRKNEEPGLQVVYQAGQEDRPPREAEPQGPELPPAQLKDKWEAVVHDLRSGLSMVMEGLRNAEHPDTSTEHAIQDDIEGLETDNFKLMRHQKDGIGRCLYLIEKFGAFLLADDMGLGKTAEVLGIILLLRKKQREDPQYCHKPFLIVVPPSLIPSWLEELRDRTPSLKVLRFGAQGTTYTAKDLRDADVVLSGYGPLETIYSHLATCQINFKATREGFDDELMESLGARYERRQQQPRGRQAGGKVPELVEERCREPLLSIEWAGVILDEAHNIKNAATNRAQMMRLFKTEVRGAMTGTPVQNGFLDFQALLRFLRIPPWDNPQLFRACFLLKRLAGKRRRSTRFLARLNDAILSAIRSCITVRRLKDQMFDGQPILDVPDWKETTHFVALTEESKEYQKTTRDIWDPVRRAEIAEAKELAKVRGESSATIRKPDPEVLANILRAKLHVIHPELINARYGEFGLEDLDNTEVGDARSYDVNPIEALPGVNPEEALLLDQTAIARKYERRLSAEELRLRDKRREVFVNKFKTGEKQWKSDRLFTVVELVEELLERRKSRAEAKATDREKKEYLATHKILVFSEYLSALDITSIGIQKLIGIDPLRFDGTCSNQERVKARHLFEELVDGVHKDFSRDDVHPHDVPVMLVSNKAGAEGITLVHASDVIHVGMIWNPANEDQCITRAARKGRNSAVRVHRLMSRGSIDQRVMQIHEVKRAKVSRIMDDEYLLGYKKHMDDWELNDASYIKAVGADRIMSAIKGGRLQVQVD
ncbi:hypothetical protein NU195Hw_g7366t1 [Hortaea werneckii]